MVFHNNLNLTYIIVKLLKKLFMSKEIFSKNYKIWLITLLLIIPIMVVLGGYTRLTDSGLSITEWNLFTGILPPLTEDDWQELFYKYQQIPQFIINNPLMEINDFKNIFWLEYLHRILGRVIGIIIILPAIYFYLQKKTTITQRKFLITISVIVIFQGFMGWFMVSSGLDKLTSVSHYRLAAHLFIAFIIYSIIFNHYFIYQLNLKKIIKNNKQILTIKFFFYLLIIQIIYGAFVAGLDAGLIYNQFPLMDENFFPNEILNNNIKDILFTDHASIQFIHRMIAVTLILLGIYMVKIGLLQIKLLRILIVLLLCQFIVGVITLLTIVNFHVAIIHQLIALFLFSLANLSVKICSK
jgi:cytochrome c oxidase assembly protein subunit 15